MLAVSYSVQPGVLSVAVVIVVGSHVILLTHRFDMLLKDFRDSLRVLGTLSRDVSQVADLPSVWLLKILERFCKVNSDI